MKRFAIVFVCFLVVAAGVQAGVQTQTYTIKPGDSLSIIAEQALLGAFGIAPRPDINQYTERIAEHNNVRPRELRPGQTIELPVYNHLQENRPSPAPETKAKTTTKPMDDQSKDKSSTKEAGPEPETSKVDEQKNTAAQKPSMDTNPWGTVKTPETLSVTESKESKPQKTTGTPSVEQAVELSMKQSAREAPDGVSVPSHTIKDPPLTVRELARSALNQYTEQPVRTEDVFRLRRMIVKENDLSSIDYSTNSYVLSGDPVKVPAYRLISEQASPDLKRVPEQTFTIRSGDLRPRTERMLNADLHVRDVAKRLLSRAGITSKRAIRQYANFLSFVAYRNLRPKETLTVPPFHVVP